MYSVYTSWTACTLSGERYYFNVEVPPNTRPTNPVSFDTAQSQLIVCSHNFKNALFSLVHTGMSSVCTSTCSHRSQSHFISNQAGSSLWLFQPRSDPCSNTLIISLNLAGLNQYLLWLYFWTWQDWINILHSYPWYSNHCSWLTWQWSPFHHLHHSTSSQISSLFYLSD